VSRFRGRHDENDLLERPLEIAQYDDDEVSRCRAWLKLLDCGAAPLLQVSLLVLSCKGDSLVGPIGGRKCLKVAVDSSFTMFRSYSGRQ
jgi:hypothetical protein